MGETPTHPGVYVEELTLSGRSIAGVPTSITAFVGRARRGPRDEPTTVRSFAEFKTVFGRLAKMSRLGYAVRDFFRNGGGEAVVIRLAPGRPLERDDFIGPGKRETGQGLYALDRADLFNLLYIPPYLPTGDVDPELVDVAASYCEQRSAMLLLDPLSHWVDEATVSGDLVALGTSSANAAVFFPRIRQPDPLLNGQVGDFPPGGSVAGVIARMDAARGVWKAPAGREATLVGVTELSSPMPTDSGALSSLGVNCLQILPEVGCVVWGARTLQGNDQSGSDWQYISVRRTALYIEQSIFRGIQWAVFEPNDGALWSQLKSRVQDFLVNLWRQGALVGEKPEQAYFVTCDRTTMTQTEIDEGFVNVLVGFAPIKPAEFVIVRVRQRAGQAAPQP